MARLTRMQKYADLREQLSNSKEETSISQELKAYEDKLANVQDILTPRQPVEEDPRYIWNEFHEEVQDEPVNEVISEVAIDDSLNFVKTFEEPIVETIEKPVIETIEQPVVEKKEEIVESQNTEKKDNQTVSSYFDSFFSEVKEEPATNVFGDFNSYFDSYNQTTTKPTVEEPVINNEEIKTVEEPIVEKVEEVVIEDTTAQPESVIVEPTIEPIVEPVIEPTVEPTIEPIVEPTVEEPVVEKIEEVAIEDTTIESEDVAIEDKTAESENVATVFADVPDNSDEIVSQKERDTYLNQTFSDVNLYNIDKGEVTIDKLIDDSIDEVRHPKQIDDDSVETFAQVDNSNSSVEEIERVNDTEEAELLDADVITEKIDEQTNGMNDDEFSSTVSLEISKIMEELSSTNAEDSIAIEELNRNFNNTDITQDNIVVEEPAETDNQTIEEKPEEVVEIKNISELEKDNTPTNTMSTTIPFVVTDDNDSIEEDEENGSNTVLNVILIVLIVILVAVLGLIVFYILKTKGVF